MLPVSQPNFHTVAPYSIVHYIFRVPYGMQLLSQTGSLEWWKETLRLCHTEQRGQEWSEGGEGKDEDLGITVWEIKETMSASQMAPCSLYSEPLLTRAHRAMVKVVHYIGNWVPFGMQVTWLLLS